MLSNQSTTKRQYLAAKYASGRILDIGYAQLPNPYLKGIVTGIDIDRADCPSNYSNTMVMDIDDIESLPHDTYDSIVVLETIEHIQDHETFLMNASKLLRRKGRLIISTPNPYYYRTLFGNVLFPSGTANTIDHISVYIPRVLNNVADQLFFKLIKIINPAKLPIPFMNYQWIYVYEKVS